jgi:LysM repeat protein
MKSWVSLLSGIASALVLGVLVFGSLGISLIGNGIPPELAQSLLVEPIQPILTLQEEAGSDDSSLNPPDVQAIFPPPPADCLPPVGWHPIEVTSGENLTSIASIYAIPIEQLMEANCLELATVVAGAVLYVPDLPPTPTATATPAPTETTDSGKATKSPIDNQPCAKPAGWVVYTVRAGDTLYKISLATKTTVAALQRANCLGFSTIIHPGESLIVPFQPIMTVLPTRPAYKSPTPSAVPTEIITTLPPTATDQPTKTPQPTDPPPTEPPTEPPPGP